MVSLSVVVCFAVLAAAAATDVQQCPGLNLPILSNSVQLSPCKKPPCKLKKGTDQHITINFTPEKEMADVITKVTGDLGIGIEVPFVGVDGSSICDKVYTEDGEKASCPLQAGTNYSYKDSFPILNVYPNINVKVHWELKHNEKSFVCFEVPAKIVSKAQ